MNKVVKQDSETEPSLALKPASLDLLSPRVQMSLAAIVLLVLCFFSQAPCLKLGFMLDDFLHIDYVSRAFHGSPGDFLSNFYSNWGASPLMKSYRPLVSFSFFVDYLFFQANAWGYHLVNLLLLFASSLFVGLIGLELSGMRGNRLGASAAVWAALLFVVYPLHLEASAWIVGRVDLLCTLFSLISIFAYLRFRLLREKYLFKISMLAFVLAMASKEMAATVPLVIAACEILLYPYFGENPSAGAVKKIQQRRWSAVLSFFLVLGFFAAARLLALGTVIGGYSESGILAHLRNFLNPEPLQRILYPLNLDILRRTGEWDLRQSLERVLKGAYLALLINGGVRLILLKSSSWRILLFLAFWILVSVLPTAQVWLISPNLVGGRLFYMGSAPFVILLVFLALPAIDSLKKSLVKVSAAAGVLSLLLIAFVWSYWLQIDLKAWSGAAASMETFKNQLLSSLRTLDKEKKILLLNLPADYSGAGMITRSQYLRFLLLSPHTIPSYAERVEVLEAPDGAIDFDYSEALSGHLKNSSIARTLFWQDSLKLESGAFKEITIDGSGVTGRTLVPGAANCKFLAPENLASDSRSRIDFDKLEILDLAKPDACLLRHGGRPCFIAADKGITIRSGAKPSLLLLNSSAISTLKAKNVEIDIRCTTASAASCPALSLLWLGECWEENEKVGTGKRYDDETRIPGTPIFEPELKGKQSFQELDFVPGQNPLLLNLGRQKNWALAAKVSYLAIYLPAGDYELEFKSLRFF